MEHTEKLKQTLGMLMQWHFGKPRLTEDCIRLAESLLISLDPHTLFCSNKPISCAFTHTFL